MKERENNVSMSLQPRVVVPAKLFEVFHFYIKNKIKEREAECAILKSELLWPKESSLSRIIFRPK